MIPHVDENDEVIGYAQRSALSSDQCYRVSALWLTNSNGDVLLAQRALTKEHNPGMWGPAAAGTVEKGETYEENILKEIYEELGVNVSVTQGPKTLVNASYYHFTQWFFAQEDIPIEDFTLQEEEVAAVRWFSREELESAIQETPEIFLDSMIKMIPSFLSSS